MAERQFTNRYRQVRLTYTEEAGGHLSVSLYVKPLNKAWTEQQCLWRYRAHAGEHCQDLEGVAARVILLLEDAFPGLSHTSE